MMYMRLQAFIVVAIALAIGVPARATLITVDSGGGGDFTTVQAGMDAAFADTSQAHTVRILNSAVYDEYVTKTNGTASAFGITLEPAAGQTPTLYGIQMWNVGRTITAQNLTFDGNLRDYTDAGSGRQAQLVYFRDGGDSTLRNSTVKGRGQFQSVTLYGKAGATKTLDGNTFASDTAKVAIDGTSANIGTLAIKNNLFQGAQGIDSTNGRGDAGTLDVNHNIFDQNSDYGFYYRGFGLEMPGTTLENNTFYKSGGNGTFSGGAIFWRDNGDTEPNITILDNLFQGQGAATTNFDGLHTRPGDVTALAADNNGFYDMREVAAQPVVASFNSSWKTVNDLNFILSGSNNIIGPTDPFVGAAGGDFHLSDGNWATTAASDGSYIGALPPVSDIPEPTTFALLVVSSVLMLGGRKRI